MISASCLWVQSFLFFNFNGGKAEVYHSGRFLNLNVCTDNDFVCMYMCKLYIKSWNIKKGVIKWRLSKRVAGRCMHSSKKSLWPRLHSRSGRTQLLMHVYVQFAWLTTSLLPPRPPQCCQSVWQLCVVVVVIIIFIINIISLPTYSTQLLLHWS